MITEKQTFSSQEYVHENNWIKLWKLNLSGKGPHEVSKSNLML